MTPAEVMNFATGRRLYRTRPNNTHDSAQWAWDHAVAKLGTANVIAMRQIGPCWRVIVMKDDREQVHTINNKRAIEGAKARVRPVGHPLKLARLTAVFKAPMTQAQMAREADLADSTVSRYVKILHAAGKCHVSDWSKDKLKPMAVYSPCAGEDVPNPFDSAVLAAANKRRHKKKLKQQKSLEKREREKRRQEAISRPVRRDPFVAALFGEVNHG